MEQEEASVNILKDGAEASNLKTSSVISSTSNRQMESTSLLNFSIDRNNLIEEFYAAVVDGNLSLTKHLLTAIMDFTKQSELPEPSKSKRSGIKTTNATKGIQCDFHTALDVEKMFQLASKGEEFHILQYLIQTLPFDTYVVGSRLLEQALELQNAQIVKSVLDRGVSANERVNGSYIRWGSFVMYTFPLHVAAIAGNIAVLSILLKYGARLDMLDTDGNTALMLACAGNHINVVKALVEAGADLNLTDSNQRSALVISAALNNTDVISLIADRGGQISERMLLRACEITSVNAEALELLLQTLPEKGLHVDWYRLLNVASSFRKPNIVDVLLRHMPNSLKLPGVKAQDVLTSALCNKHHGEKITLRLLAENFVDINGRNSGGDYPLHIAVQYCSLPFCSSLISSFSADINSKDALKRTPLMLSLYCCREHKGICGSADETALSIMKYLIEHGADISAQDAEGHSNLHYAVMQDNTEAVKILIKAGSNISVCDSNGMNALELFWKKTLLIRCPITDLINCIFSGSSFCWKENNDPDLHRMLEEKLNVMTTLLEAGAIFENQSCQKWVLYTLLPYKLDSYVPLMLGKGIFPQQVIDTDDGRKSCMHLDNDISCILDSSITPFSLAFCMQNFDIALYLYNNWFLTRADIDMMNKKTSIMKDYIANANKSLVDFEKLQEWCKSLFLAPHSLQLLSFVTVSDLIRPNKGRDNRVKTLGLPPSMQRRLLYTASLK